jgi:hypothetical protein
VVEGERVLGRFTVGERIGAGGHGTVHRAWDERLCREVAIKSVEGPAGRRVVREAHAAARLNHPGIVTLYELGEERGAAYLVSELVRGSNLRELAADAALSDRDLAEIGAELCAALSHAHAQGVIHRDLKPDNVLIRSRRSRGSGAQAMLVDFGIAAVADEPGLTATGQVVGTLSYMAPEHAAGRPAGPPADVYSLALTLYELWVGRNPVVGPGPAATARRIGSRLPPLAELRPELPELLQESIDAALDPDPAQRPELDELRGALESVSAELVPDRSVPEPELPADSPEPAREPAAAGPLTVLLVAGAIAALGLLAGQPGPALTAILLLAPAILLLARPREWIAPVTAPLLGLIGAAPAFLVWAANHPRAAGRAALAGLGWAWTVVLGSALGRSLGVAPADSGGADLLAPLVTPEVLAAGVIWVGAALLLGLAIDYSGPALLAILGLVWAAGLAAALAALGGAAAPSALLAPALLVALGWLVWDRAGRPEPGPWLHPPDRGRRAEAGGPAPRERASRHQRPAPPPLGDAPTRAARRASRHVDAALYRAGSGGGLP